ncbi:plasmid recombination protein [Sphingomonas carotinifaciens]|uniref:plasmid recombination protein n=1 Tax=Sphingomonas carotinifaciens TaxID=1166323 RepID=UPI000DDB0882|nr:plasmid recombination protein [Sphingomonas carotinifaciens]
MAKHYGVLTFDNRGPIKTWERMTATQRHNARSESLPHCDPAAPGPVYIIGSPDLVSDTKAALREHGIDPAGIRKNGVIAYEVIMTASHAYFTEGDEAERTSRLWQWVARAYLAAKKIWGSSRIVQMVLHLDEFTPHLHVVLLPLVQKVFSRRQSDGPQWTLDGREIAGPGQYQRAHNEYAAQIEPLGLSRGEQKSGRKYRPYSDVVAEVETKMRKAAMAAAAGQKAQQEAALKEQAQAAQWAEQSERAERERAALGEREKGLAKRLLRAELHERSLKMRERKAATAEMEVQRKVSEADRLLTEARQMQARLTGQLRAIADIRSRADDLVALLDQVEAERLTQAQASALTALGGMSDAIVEAGLDEDMALVEQMAAHGASRGR